MNRIKIILALLHVGLSLTYGQTIANYIANGNFEDRYNCIYDLKAVKYWTSIDSISPCAVYMGYCNNYVPNNVNTVYQLPRSGNGFVASTFYNPSITNNCRKYIKNRLKSTLTNGKTYCVTFHVNITNMSTYGNDGIGIYFGDNTIDTITHFNIPLHYLTPQVKNPSGVPIVDTLGWVQVKGNFVANGNEKYALIGIFAKNGTLDTALVNPAWLPGSYTDQCIEDVSCIEFDLPAYAGPDQSIFNGDSAFIGRQPDFAIDPYCTWYKLPNTTTSIDTISGLWVKPTATSTYVVKQELDCGSLKWDTVVIHVDYVGIKELQVYSDNINLFPNPTTYNLNVSFVHGISQLSITNSLGQIIRQQDLDPKNNQVILQTSDLSNGIYQIHFKTSFGAVTKKFVKVN